MGEEEREAAGKVVGESNGNVEADGLGCPLGGHVGVVSGAESGRGNAFRLRGAPSRVGTGEEV